MSNKQVLTGFVVIVLGLFGFGLYAQIEDQTISACVSKYNVMRFSDDGDCHQGETLITWNIEGEKGDKGDPGEQGPQGESGSNIYLSDANGQDLGLVIGTNETNDTLGKIITYIPSIDGVFNFSQKMNTETLQYIVEAVNGFAQIYFENLDCTGQAYYPLSTSGMPTTILVTSGNRFFKINDLIKETSYQSFLTNVCTNNNESYGRFREVEEVTVPFSWPPVGPLQIKEM